METRQYYSRIRFQSSTANNEKKCTLHRYIHKLYYTSFNLIIPIYNKAFYVIPQLQRNLTLYHNEFILILII